MDAFALDISGAWTANVPRERGEMVLFNLTINGADLSALTGVGSQQVRCSSLTPPTVAHLLPSSPHFCLRFAHFPALFRSRFAKYFGSLTAARGTLRSVMAR